MGRLGRFWDNHQLSIVLITIFIAMSVGYWFAAIPDWRDQVIAQGGTPMIWPDYTRYYISEMLVSNLADVFGAIVLVLFTKWWTENKSAESN